MPSETISAKTDIPNFINTIIDDGRIRLVQKIGEGGYGVVYRAVDESAPCDAPQDEYAVKILIRAERPTREWRYQQREIAVHTKVSGAKNILTLQKVVTDDRFIYLVTDYCPGGDLFHTACERMMYCNNDALVKSVFLQIVDGVQACHDQGIFHRDLKPDNIFCNGDGTQVVVGDFGLSTTTQLSDGFGCGSSFYMSPECLGVDHEFAAFCTRSSDVWALGIILTNMIAGRNPWSVATLEDRGFVRFLADPTFLSDMLPISATAVALLARIFTFRVETRISLAELRAEVLNIDTFFMSDEALSRASNYAREAARMYGRVIPAAVDAVDATLAVAMEGLVLSTCSSDASRTDSEGPFTPETHAQDGVNIADIPELAEGEGLGAPAVSDLHQGAKVLSLETVVHIQAAESNVV